MGNGGEICKIVLQGNLLGNIERYEEESKFKRAVGVVGGGNDGDDDINSILILEKDNCFNRIA